jgi:hypothetical protein
MIRRSLEHLELEQHTNPQSRIIHALVQRLLKQVELAAVAFDIVPDQLRRNTRASARNAPGPSCAIAVSSSARAFRRSPTARSVGDASTVRWAISSSEPSGVRASAASNSSAAATGAPRADA